MSTRERPPRLFLPFAVLTALGVAAAAALVVVVVQHGDADQAARREATDTARLAARAVLAPALRPSDLGADVPIDRRRQLARLLEGRVLVEGIVSASLYGSDGRMVQAAGRGRHPGSPASVRRALAGVTVSETARAGDGSGVLRTYVPVAGSRGHVLGVVRLDQEHGRAGAGARTSVLVASVLEGLLLLLVLALVPVLGRASARLRAHAAELEHAATHDEPTGLPNRLGFVRLAGPALQERAAATIALVDLDGFSEIERSLGFECCDRLLAEAAARLERELAPDGALVARLGDGELGVLHAARDPDGAAQVARRIRRSFEAPFAVDGVRLAVDVDVGAALHPLHGPDVETLLGRASAALAAARADGASGVHVYEPARDAVAGARPALAADLQDALDRDELRLHYQPQLDLLTNRIRGVEALLRWQHPERGLLAAGDFVIHGERGRLARDLRRFVLTTAARQWEEWHAVEPELELELALNLSATDVLDPALPGELEEAAARHGIPPSSLVLELTERTLIRDDRRARHAVEQLGRIGVRLAIDDFGTGYSSLAALRAFPLHQVKLDRSLIADVPGDEAAEAIVGGSVEIAHGLGALVVAEGVETMEQLRFAATVGCDVAQGYLVGRPAPPESVLELLETPRLAPLSAA